MSGDAWAFLMIIVLILAQGVISWSFWTLGYVQGLRDGRFGLQRVTLRDVMCLRTRR